MKMMMRILMTMVMMMRGVTDQRRKMTMQTCRRMNESQYRELEALP
jgi:hypothetical protein